MLKIGSSTYRELNRVSVEDEQWIKFRAFVRVNQSELSQGVFLYINSDTNKDDFYLDDVEIATTSYTPPTTDSNKILKIVGSNIYDSDSNALRFKGINLTAYLDDNETAEDFYKYSYLNYDKSDFKNIKSLGFNSVRINLWYKLFEDDSNPGVFKEEGLEWLDTVIGWAKEADLYVMLDMHAPQGGSFQGPNHITSFWNNTVYQDRFVKLWEHLVNRYKYESTVGAYDIINEPCPNNEAQYQTLLSRTITAIRAIDDKHILNVETSFASDTQAFVLNETNILYDFHFYDPWNSYTDDANSVYGTNGLNYSYIKGLFDNYISLYKQSGVAFGVSEFGQKYSTFDTKNASGWVDDVFTILNENSASYHYFTYKGSFFGLYGGENRFAENSNINNSLKTIFLKQ